MHEEYYEKDVELSLAEPKSYGRRNSSEGDKWVPSNKLLISTAVILVLAVGILIGLAVHTVRAGVFGDLGL